MSELQTQLHDYLNTLVERTPALRVEDIIHAGPRTRPDRRARRGRRAAVSLAVAFAVVMGAVIAVHANNSTGPVVSAGPSLVTRAYRDETNGFSLKLPSGWRALRPAANPTGPQNLVDVRSPEGQTPGLVTRCRPSTVHGVSGGAIWIGLNEERYTTGPIPGRPETFAPQPGQYDPALAALGPITTPPGCPSPTQILFDFIDHQRKFQFEIVAGPNASRARLTEAYGILDSLRVETPAQLHRSPSPTVSIPTVLVPYVPAPPPQGVRVYVVNGSNRSGADATLAARLRGLGYSVVGIETATTLGQGFTTASGQTLSITSCRAGFSELGAGTLAHAAFGPSGVSGNAALEAFIEAHNSDCVVVIGQAPNTNNSSP
jgi:hypothetical protein